MASKTTKTKGGKRVKAWNAWAFMPGLYESELYKGHGPFPKIYLNRQLAESIWGRSRVVPVIITPVSRSRVGKK